MHPHLSLVEFPPRKLLGALAATSLLQCTRTFVGQTSDPSVFFFLEYYLSVGSHKFRQI